MNPTLHSRRHFLKTSFLGGALAWTVPVFLEKTFLTLEAAAAGGMAPGTDSHPILVVVQLAGGNDGLNTVIPWADDAYFRARPKLAIEAAKVLKTGDYAGLHPTLTGLRGLYDEGLAAVVQGVGYPNPNRSHFRSTDIWQTATDADRVSSQGWLGRYFDACCSGEDPASGVAIARQEPLAFAGDTPRSISFQDPNQFVKSAADSGMDADEDSGELQGGSIDMLGGGVSMAGGDAADFLRRTALDARLSADRIGAITSKFAPTKEFPKSRLGRSLDVVARLIAGGMPTRVYYVSQGGYDTHSRQQGNHERLLGELDQALTAFLGEMKAMKCQDRVMVMTFSEFGRRVAENASGGTDHGAAAPMFLLGGMVNAGFHGQYPSLEKLDKGDLIHTVDFRSVYATVLRNWLAAPDDQVLGSKFSTLPLVKGSAA